MDVDTVLHADCAGHKRLVGFGCIALAMDWVACHGQLVLQYNVNLWLNFHTLEHALCLCTPRRSKEVSRANHISSRSFLKPRTDRTRLRGISTTANASHLKTTDHCTTLLIRSDIKRRYNSKPALDLHIRYKAYLIKDRKTPPCFPTPAASYVPPSPSSPSHSQSSH